MPDQEPLVTQPLEPFCSGPENSQQPVVSLMAAGQLDVAALTHRGGRRENQDRFLLDADQNLIMVADGVGGLKEGGLAAEVGCKAIQADVAAGLPLDRAVSRASSAIAKEATLRGMRTQMGSTIVALQCVGARLQLVWVGDSSASAFWDGAAYRLTRDHTEAAEWITHGIHTESSVGASVGASVGTSGRRHVLTQALGVTPPAELRLGRNEGALRSGEWLVLASDGVTNVLDIDDLSVLIAGANDSASAAEAMMSAALERNPSDNATLVVAHWLGESGAVEDLPRVYPA